MPSLRKMIEIRIYEIMGKHMGDPYGYDCAIIEQIRFTNDCDKQLLDKIWTYSIEEIISECSDKGLIEMFEQTIIADIEIRRDNNAS